MSVLKIHSALVEVCLSPSALLEINYIIVLLTVARGVSVQAGGSVGFCRSKNAASVGCWAEHKWWQCGHIWRCTMNFYRQIYSNLLHMCELDIIEEFTLKMSFSKDWGYGPRVSLIAIRP